MKYILALLLLFSTVCAFAQVSGNINRQMQNRQYNYRVEAPQAVFQERNVINIDIKGMMNAKADSYVAIFATSSIAESIEQTDQIMNDRLTNIKAAIAELAGETTVYIDMISLLPVYEIEEEKKIFSKKTYNEVPKGFELRKNLHIGYKNPEDLDRVLTICAKNEVYDLVKVDYVINDIESIYDSLRNKTLALVKKKLKFYDELGIELEGKKRELTESAVAYFPPERYRQYQVNTSNFLYNDKKMKSKNNATLFYSPLASKGFDMFVNSEIIEPMVQFTYNLKLRIDLNEKPKETKV